MSSICAVLRGAQAAALLKHLPTLASLYAASCDTCFAHCSCRRNIDLLYQACTHDSTGSQPSYRELAFLGDAVLWLLFAEHAFKAYGSTEDPIRWECLRVSLGAGNRVPL